jgi:hypothetical protein
MGLMRLPPSCTRAARPLDLDWRGYQVDEMESPVTPSPPFLPLWARLRGHGHLWHRTSLPSLENILRDSEIVPNMGQLQPTYGQSQVSYARHLSAVSLFDFDTADEPYIFEHEWKWGMVLTGQLPAGVLIRIRREAVDRANLLLPTEISGGDHRLDTLPKEIRKMHMVIPAVEALHIGPISASAFSGFILTAFKEHGGYLWREVGSDADAFRILSEISAKWNANHERRTAKCHASGEYTLAEILEQAV